MTQNNLGWIIDTTFKKFGPSPPKMTNVIFFVLKASLKELSQTDDEDKRTFINLPERNFPAVWLGYSLV